MWPASPLFGWAHRSRMVRQTSCPQPRRIEAEWMSSSPTRAKTRRGYAASCCRGSSRWGSEASSTLAGSGQPGKRQCRTRRERHSAADSRRSSPRVPTSGVMDSHPAFIADEPGASTGPSGVREASSSYSSRLMSCTLAVSSLCVSIALRSRSIASSNVCSGSMMALSGSNSSGSAL